jgi:hypothetical protein
MGSLPGGKATSISGFLFQIKHVTAVRLIGKHQFRPTLIQSLPYFAQSVPGCVVLLTEMGQHNMGQAVVLDIHQQLPGGFIGQMPDSAFDPLFQGPWVGTVFQQPEVMVGFQDQQIALPEMVFDHGGCDTQIGCHTDFAGIVTDRETGGICGIMGGGERVDGQGTDLKGAAAFKRRNGG